MKHPLACAILLLLCSVMSACASGSPADTSSLGEREPGPTRAEALERAVHDGSEFFTAPAGWSLVSADNAKGVYKLKHDEIEDASIILSYDALESRGDGRLPRLETIHQNVITKLPGSLETLQSEMTRYQGEPKYYTILRGKLSESAPELIVAGYTIALEQDAFTVFAAYPVDARTLLAAEVESLMYSLKPYAPIALAEEEPEGEGAPLAQPSP